MNAFLAAVAIVAVAVAIHFHRAARRAEARLERAMTWQRRDALAQLGHRP